MCKRLLQKRILKQYKWLNPKCETFVIMGDDLDSALSVVLYLNLNPKAKLIGIYNKYKEIYFSSCFEHINTLINQNNLIWIDLDIYNHKCKSLGHHIVRYSKNDKINGFNSSCNINNLVGRTVQDNFSQKYPLGTIHFLLWLYKINPGIEKNIDALIWLADSSFINGQSHKFRSNVQNWIENIICSNYLIQVFQEIDKKEFEERICCLQCEMEQKGFKRGKGQVESKHLKLSGFQCQPENIPQDIINLLSFVSEKTQWKFREEQIQLDNLKKVKGERENANIADILKEYKTLDNFLEKENIFSYVFTQKRNINYTVFKNL